MGERVQSPHDPEMHYSTKRGMEWSGYKVHDTEACDDDTAHVITHVRTGPAMLPDMASTGAIHAALAAKGLLPGEHYVDSGYVDADLLVSSRRDHGISLEGPVRAMPRRRTEAERAARILELQTHGAFSVYRCDFCRRWHVGSDR